jgi:hypothetical protein
MSDLSRSEAARKLSALGASKGGRARAASLTSEQRRDIARRAVQARWERAGRSRPQAATSEAVADDAPTVRHSAYSGTLRIGQIAMECHVLDDGRRVLLERSIVRLLSGGRERGNLLRHLRRNRLFGDTIAVSQVRFSAASSPGPIVGYEATELVDICELYLGARDQGLLRPSQLRLAKLSEVIVRACAKFGINTLVDEATGYHVVSAGQRRRLAIEALISEEVSDWALVLPDAFWLELARLEGTSYSPRSRPLRWARYVLLFAGPAIESLIGTELHGSDPGPQQLRRQLQRLRRHGRERVVDQLRPIVTLMAASESIRDFEDRFERASGTVTA